MEFFLYIFLLAFELPNYPEEESMRTFDLLLFNIIKRPKII